MELHYRLAGHIPLERANQRWETDVIEIDGTAPVTVDCIQTQRTFQITGPATLVADTAALGTDHIQITQMRLLWYLPFGALNMDARVFHVDKKVRSELREAEASGLLPLLPYQEALTEPVYCVRTGGGFVPPVPKGWNLVQLTSHQTKWAMLRRSDPRLTEYVPRERSLACGQE